MEKERIAHSVFNTLCSRTQPHRDTVAAHQIPLVTFFCVSMYGGTARGIGTYLERFWVKIPDYFCLSTYYERAARHQGSVPTRLGLSRSRSSGTGSRIDARSRRRSCRGPHQSLARDRMASPVGWRAQPTGTAYQYSHGDGEPGRATTAG